MKKRELQNGNSKTPQPSKDDLEFYLQTEVQVNQELTMRNADLNNANARNVIKIRNLERYINELEQKLEEVEEKMVKNREGKKGVNKKRG